MSLIDIEKLEPNELVVQYVIEILGNGHFLSRDDYIRVQQWMEIATSIDDLLIILQDVLPAKVELSRSKGKKMHSLSSVKKLVERRLLERRTIAGGI